MFYKILASYSGVETVISLMAFIVAAVLAYLAYTYKAKLRSTEKIVKLADTDRKADLARSLMDAFPAFRIPDLTGPEGVEVIKMQYERKATEFKSKMATIRMVVGMLVVTIIMLFGRQAYVTYGKQSPVVKGDHNTLDFNDTTR